MIIEQYSFNIRHENERRRILGKRQERQSKTGRDSLNGKILFSRPTSNKTSNKTSRGEIN